MADTVGVMTVDWDVTITDCKNKKEEKHETYVDVASRAAVYVSDELIVEHYNWLKSIQPLTIIFIGRGLRVVGKVVKPLKIFPQEPTASKETFEQGILVSTKSNIHTAIILYSPDLQHIGTLDNAGSEASTTYTKSVTSGFTFTMSQGFSHTANIGFDVEVVKGGVTVSMNLTFTESWNKSTTESYSVSVPAGQKSFIYQGYLCASVLNYFPGKSGEDEFDWASGETGRVLSNVLRTTPTPILAGATT
jgi:hypothetical protein